MHTQNGISRRQVLGMAVAVGSLAVAGGLRSVAAQAAKQIEPLAPELEKIMGFFAYPPEKVYSRRIPPGIDGL
jgi:hypothetical protein